MTELKTEKGFYWLTASGVLTLTFIIYVVLDNIFHFSFNRSGYLFIAGTILFYGILISVLIALIVGFVYFHRGRFEFSRKHQKWSSIGKTVVIISVMVSIATQISRFLYLRYGTSDSIYFLEDPVFQIFGVLTRIIDLLIIVGLVLMTIVFTGKKARYALLGGLGVLLSIPLVQIAYTAIHNAIFDDIRFFLLYPPYLLIPTGFILMTLSFFLTYRDIKAGRIRPEALRARKDKPGKGNEEKEIGPMPSGE